MSLLLLFALWVLVGALTGLLTGRNMKAYGYGPLMDLAMGVTGAVAGGFIAGSTVFFGSLGVIASVPAAVLGAILLTGFMSLASGERRHA